MNKSRRSFLNEDHKKIATGMTSRPYEGPHKESIRGLMITIESLTKAGYKEHDVEVLKLRDQIDILKMS